MTAFMRSERLKHCVSVYFAIISGQRTQIRLPMRSLECFILLNPSDLAMSLRSNRARIFPGGKGGRCIELTTLPLYVPIVWKSGILTLLEP
jgi:hypothetical protein